MTSGGIAGGFIAGSSSAMVGDFSAQLTGIAVELARLWQVANRREAERLMQRESNLTFEELVQWKIAKGLTGDAVYEDVIMSSQRSRQSVNEYCGIGSGLNTEDFLFFIAQPHMVSFYGAPNRR